MPLKLFELVGSDSTRPFSPYCWRTRMALAHKGLSAESIPWCFTEKHAIAPHQSEKVPVLLDGDTAVRDSWAIANYLEDAYPEPRLRPADPARRQTSRKRRIAMAEPMEPIAMPTMTTTTLVNSTSEPDMCMAVKMLLVVLPPPSWLMKRYTK